jgi:hypothetical protein
VRQLEEEVGVAIEAISDKGVRDQALLYKKTIDALGVKPDGIPATAWDPGFSRDQRTQEIRHVDDVRAVEDVSSRAWTKRRIGGYR